MSGPKTPPAATPPRVHALRRSHKQGLGSAYKAGFAWGLTRGHDPLFEMDADGSHHPHDLPEMLGLIRGGADLVLGSCFVQGGGIEDWPWDRLLLSRASNWLTRLALGIKVRDATAGFRAYRAHVLRAIDLPSVRADGYAFQEEMLFCVVKAGFRVIATPIVFTDRLCGTTKISRAEVFHAMTTLVRLWWQAHRHPLPEPVRDTRPAPFLGAIPKHLPTPRRLQVLDEAQA